MDGTDRTPPFSLLVLFNLFQVERNSTLHSMLKGNDKKGVRRLQSHYFGMLITLRMLFVFTDADKGVQHTSPFSFPWPLGSQFSMMGLSELKAAISLENDGVASSERQRIMKWTVDDVMSHVRTSGCVDQAKVFGEQVCYTSFDWFGKQVLVFPRKDPQTSFRGKTSVAPRNLTTFPRGGKKRDPGNEVGEHSAYGPKGIKCPRCKKRSEKCWDILDDT